MRSTLTSTLAAIGLLCAAAAVQASAQGHADAGSGPVGSLSRDAWDEHPSPLAHPHGRNGMRGWDIVADLGDIGIDPAEDDRQVERPFELTVSAQLAGSKGGGGSFSHGARFGSGLPDGVRLPATSARFLSAVPQGLPSPPAAALAVVALALVPGAWRRLHCTACRR